MMLQIGVGYTSHALRTLQTQQPSQGLSLVVASDEKAVTVSATALTVEVPEPSAHAGSYPLALADLARGPVCLAAPAIRNAGDVPTVEPGLWAYDAARGAARIVRQWLSDGTVVEGQTGLTFAPVALHAGRDIVHVETVRQGGIETTSLSAALTLPGVSVPLVTSLGVTREATLEIVADPAATANIQVIEPAAYAGRHAVQAALLAKGPLWLVPARIEGAGQAGTTLSVLHRGLHASARAAGPVSVQGQWQRNGAPIAGATLDSYQVQAADSGQRIGFLETATNAHGSRQQLSNEIVIGGAL